jgi:hypothetical protein
MRLKTGGAILCAVMFICTTAWGASKDRIIGKEKANPLFEESVFVSGRIGAGSATLVGFNVGMEQPIWKLTGDIAFKYLSFGPQLSVLFGDGGVFGDIDVFVKGQLPINVPYGFLAAHLIVPVGLSIEGYGRRGAVGYNVALTPGIQYYFNRNVGLHYNMGFGYHGIAKDSGFQHFLEGLFELGFVYSF